MAATAGSAGRTVLDEGRIAAGQVQDRATDAAEDVRESMPDGSSSR